MGNVKEKVQGWTGDQKQEVLDAILNDAGIVEKLKEKFNVTTSNSIKEKEGAEDGQNKKKEKSFMDSLNEFVFGK